MKIRKSFIDAPLVNDDTRLTHDVYTHLQEHLPQIVQAYPLGYFLSLIRHSATLARDHFGLNEIAAIRLFVRLRWEIAPGFYNEPTIMTVLSDRSVRAIERFETLLTPDHDHVWLDAMEYDGPAYWRGQYSDGFGDMVYDEAAL